MRMAEQVKKTYIQSRNDGDIEVSCQKDLEFLNGNGSLILLCLLLKYDHSFFFSRSW